MDRLPTEQEHEQVYTGLATERDRLQKLVWRVEDICEAAPSDLPQPVSLSEIGIVAVLADDADQVAGQLQEFAGRLRDSIGALEAHRDTSKLDHLDGRERLT
jgi:hypothetical protein